MGSSLADRVARTSGEKKSPHNCRISMLSKTTFFMASWRMITASFVALIQKHKIAWNAAHNFTPKKSKLKMSSACKTMETVCRMPKDGYGSRVGYKGKPSVPLITFRCFIRFLMLWMTNVLGRRRLSCNMAKHHPPLLTCMCGRNWENERELLPMHLTV